MPAWPGMLQGAVALTTSLVLAGASQAAVQYVQISPTATQPPSQVGPVPVLPFLLAPQAAIANGTTGVTTIPGVPGPATGSLTVAPGTTKFTMPGTWNDSWRNSYTGPIFFSSATTATLTLPARTTAFHVFISPNTFGTFTVVATTNSGTTSGTITINDNNPTTVPGLGFYTTTAGETIQTIRLVTNDAAGMAMGLFGLAQAPAAPTLSSATSGPGQAVLAFSAISGSHTISTFSARCTPQGGGAVVTASGASSPLTVNGLTNGTPYDCTVTATSAAGTGVASPALAVTPFAAPTAPSIVSATPGNSQAVLALQAPASNGGSPIQRYDVSCTPQGGGAAVLASGSASPLTVSGLSNGTTYSCISTATNQAGLTSVASAAVNVTPVTAPTAPTITSATPGVTRVVLEITPPADNGGSPIQRYDVSCSPQGGGATLSGSGASSPVEVSGMASGVAYSCTATATSQAGLTSPMSVAVNVTTRLPVPVPALGAWGLALLAALMGMLGMRRSRKV